MNECRKKNINIELFQGLKWQILLSGAGADVGAAWSRPFLPGDGADPIWSEPESAPGPRTSGAGSGTA